MQAIPSPFEQITASCKEVLKYYVQREMIKKTMSKDYLVMHKFKRPYVRASGSVDRATQRQKSVTNSAAGDWDFRLPH